VNFIDFREAKIGMTTEQNDNVKILWDFNIHTDRVIEARGPGIIVIDKHNAETTIIDIAVPVDYKVKEKRIREDRKI